MDLLIFVVEICYFVRVSVVISVRQSFIFGNDFAKQFGIVIDFLENSWNVQRILGDTH